MGPRRCPRQCGERSPRGCPSQCGEGSPRGFAWVRVSVCVGAGSGPRVGPRGCVLVRGGCGIWVCVRPRGSTSVVVSIPVSASQCGIWVGMGPCQGRCGWQGFVLFPGGLRDTVTGPVKGCVHSIAILNVRRGVLAARFG